MFGFGFSSVFLTLVGIIEVIIGIFLILLGGFSPFFLGQQEAN